MGIRSNLAKTFTFPNPVNEVAARTVAAGVVLLSLMIFALGLHWLVFVLLYGFIARVAAGPRFSPLGQLATRIVAPHIGVAPKMVAGPPKRFAQGIGLVFSVAATLSFFVVGSAFAGDIIVSILALFAFMESALGFCAGCKMFAVGMKLGLVPEEVCLECANIWDRQKVSAR